MSQAKENHGVPTTPNTQMYKQLYLEYQQETIKSYCTEVFGINSLWEYYDHTLQH